MMPPLEMKLVQLGTTRYKKIGRRLWAEGVHFIDNKNYFLRICFSWKEDMKPVHIWFKSENRYYQSIRKKRSQYACLWAKKAVIMSSANLWINSEEQTQHDCLHSHNKILHNMDIANNSLRIVLRRGKMFKKRIFYLCFVCIFPIIYASDVGRD